MISSTPPRCLRSPLTYDRRGAEVTSLRLGNSNCEPRGSKGQDLSRKSGSLSMTHSQDFRTILKSLSPSLVPPFSLCFDQVRQLGLEGFNGGKFHYMLGEPIVSMCVPKQRSKVQIVMLSHSVDKGVECPGMHAWVLRHRQGF